MRTRRVRPDPIARSAFEVGVYDPLPGRDTLVDCCGAHIDAVLRVPHVPAHEQAGTVRAVAAAPGRARAGQGVPLAVLVDSDRVGLRVLWEAVVQADRGEGPLDRDRLARATSAIWSLQDMWVQSMTDAYQKAAQEKILARERERSALVGALLDGHARDAKELWDAVEALRLPHDSVRPPSLPPATWTSCVLFTRTAGVPGVALQSWMTGKVSPMTREAIRDPLADRSSRRRTRPFSSSTTSLRKSALFVRWTPSCL